MITAKSPVVSMNCSDPFTPLSIAVCKSIPQIFQVKSSCTVNHKALSHCICVVFVFGSIHTDNKYSRSVFLHSLWGTAGRWWRHVHTLYYQFCYYFFTGKHLTRLEVCYALILVPEVVVNGTLVSPCGQMDLFSW